MEQEPILRLERATIGYPGSAPLVRNISLTAGKKELVTLVGRNGAGKSTLLRSMLGLIPLPEGRCMLEGRPINRYAPRERARRISFVSSQVEWNTSLKVREVVELGRMPHTGWLGRQDMADLGKVRHALERVGVGDFAERRIDRLSDGERQRVMIARALAQDTPVIVLDEPSAYLDIPHKMELIRILSSLRQEGRTIIYSTHDLEGALSSSDKFWVITGAEVREGAPEDLGLAGVFDQLFESPSIRFDIETGRFRSIPGNRGELSLQDTPGKLYTWTRHALERAGYRVTADGGGDRVEWTSEGTRIRWTLKRSGMRKGFESLYALSRYLTHTP